MSNQDEIQNIISELKSANEIQNLKIQQILDTQIEIKTFLNVFERKNCDKHTRILGVLHENIGKVNYTIENYRKESKETYQNKKEIEPIIDFYKNIQGKIFTGFFTLLVVVGILIYGIIEFWKRK